MTLYEGAAEAVARARRLGFAVVVVSNQSGLARGMFGEADVRRVNDRMAELLLAENAEAVIDRHEWCGDHPQATVEPYRRDSPRRKPGPGMLLDAARAMNLDLKRSWLVGDAPRDVEAGHRAGCRTVLLVGGADVPASPAARAAHVVTPDFTANSLREALDFVEAHRADPPAPAERAPRSEQLLESLLDEVRHLRDGGPQDFSVAKLLAGVAQGFAVAVAVGALIYRDDAGKEASMLAWATFLQVLALTLYAMRK